MTYSLDISSGDLSMSGPGGVAVVTSQHKLVQDLRCHMLESIGHDPMHPDFGSALDGGVLPDGTVIETNIGNIITKNALLNIETEIRRILTNYQRLQLSRIRSEQSIYSGRDYFDTGEILYAVDGVQATQFGSTVVVRVSIRTASGRSINFATPIGNV